MLKGCWFSSIAQSMFCRLVSLNVQDIWLNSRCFQGKLVCVRFPSGKSTSWGLLQHTPWASPEHSPCTPTSRDQILTPPISGIRFKILKSAHEYKIQWAEFWDLAAGSRTSACSRQFAPFQGYQSPLIKAQRTLWRAWLGHTASGIREGQIKSKRYILSPKTESSAQTGSQERTLHHRQKTH